MGRIAAPGKENVFLMPRPHHESSFLAVGSPKTRGALRFENSCVIRVDVPVSRLRLQRLRTGFVARLGRQPREGPPVLSSSKS